AHCPPCALHMAAEKGPVARGSTSLCLVAVEEPNVREAGPVRVLNERAQRRQLIRVIAEVDVAAEPQLAVELEPPELGRLLLRRVRHSLGVGVPADGPVDLDRVAVAPAEPLSH